MDSFDRGEDIEQTIPLTIDGNTADTANFTEIEVSIYHKKTGGEIGSYSLTGSTVEKESPTTDGYISYKVLRTENATAKTGIYQRKVITTEADVNYPSNIRKRVGIEDSFELK